MFKQWIRIILLTLAIIALDNLNLANQLSNVAYAAEASDTAPIVGGKANHPTCEGVFEGAIIIGAIAASIVTLVGMHIAWSVSGLIGKTVITGLIIAATGALVVTIVAATKVLVCINAFVRHPVLRWDSTGKYKKCKNPELLFPGDQSSGYVCKSQEYEDASDYEWPKNKAPYSDYIEVCYRMPVFPAFLIPLGATVQIISAVANNDNMIDAIQDREKEFGFRGDLTKKEQKESESVWKFDGPNILSIKKIMGGAISCKKLKAGESTSIHAITFKAYEDGGRICVDGVGLFGAEFWMNPPKIGCHARAPSPPAPMCAKSVPTEFDSSGRATKYDNTRCFNCYISGACYSQVSLAARTSFPITSVVVQCIKESLGNLIAGTCSATSGQTSSKPGFLAVVQERLRDAVKAVLILAIALFGIKMMMGHAIQGPHEYFMLLIKLAFVIYFSLGDGMQVYYRELIKLSVGLSDLVLSAGGNDQVCNYKTADYIKDFGHGEEDYSYLAPWDRLDCRMGFYLGNGFALGAGSASAGAAIAAATTPMFGILLLVIPALFAGQILIALCVAFFIFMLLLTVIWMVHLFILSLIALTIISLFAPLFVPMVLFQATKGFFDGWVKQLMAFSIYPIILFAFLALIFSVFDKMYFEDLEFTSHVECKDVASGGAKTKSECPGGSTGKRTIEYFTPNYKQCNDSTTIIACIVSKVKYVDAPLILGIKAITADISEETEQIWKNFGMMGLMGFLFYHFLGIIGGMAAELSGSFRADLSQGSAGPKQMAAKLEAGAMTVAGGVGGALGAALKAGAEKAQGGKSEGKEEVSGGKSEGNAGSGEKREP